MAMTAVPVESPQAVRNAAASVVLTTMRLAPGFKLKVVAERTAAAESEKFAESSSHFQPVRSIAVVP